MNDAEFAQMLAEMKAESRKEHLQRWKEWYPVITTDISETMGNLLGLKAEIGRAMCRNDPAKELATLEPLVSEMLGQVYNMLGQIQGHLTLPHLLLEEAPSTSIART